MNRSQQPDIPPSSPDQRSLSIPIPDRVTLTPLSGGARMFRALLATGAFLVGCSRADQGAQFAIPDETAQMVDKVKTHAAQQREKDTATITRLSGELASATKDLDVARQEVEKTKGEKRGVEQKAKEFEVKISDLLKQPDTQDAAELMRVLAEVPYSDYFRRLQTLGSYDLTISAAHRDNLSALNVDLYSGSPFTVEAHAIHPSIVLYDVDKKILRTTTTPLAQYPEVLGRERFMMVHISDSPRIETFFMKNEVLQALMKSLQASSAKREPAITALDHTQNKRGTIDHQTFQVSDPEITEELLNSPSASDSTKVIYTFDSKTQSHRIEER